MFIYIRSAAFASVVTQKLDLQQSKNVTAKCTETLSPPPSIQYFLGGKNITGCGEFKVISCFIEKFHFYIILESRKDDATFVIKASYLEIYNEKVKKYRKNWQQKNVYFLTMSDLESVTSVLKLPDFISVLAAALGPLICPTTAPLPVQAAALGL